jgi:hypothetical protein
MAMRIHQAGHHQAARRVDHLSVRGGRRQICADGGDDAVGDQDVAGRQVAKVRVDGHDMAVLNQQFLRHWLHFSSCSLASYPVPKQALP